MQNFIVLGLVPGTHIQLTFTFWVWVTVTLLCIWMATAVVSHIDFRGHYAAHKIAHVIESYEI